MSAHRHICQRHGARWTCHADDCRSGPAPCGTCAFPSHLNNDYTVTCDDCGKPNARPSKYVKLCEPCRTRIVEQLVRGKFLG